MNIMTIIRWSRLWRVNVKERLHFSSQLLFPSNCVNMGNVCIYLWNVRERDCWQVILNGIETVWMLCPPVCLHMNVVMVTTWMFTGCLAQDVFKRTNSKQIIKNLPPVCQVKENVAKLKSYILRLSYFLFVLLMKGAGASPGCVWRSNWFVLPCVRAPPLHVCVSTHFHVGAVILTVPLCNTLVWRCVDRARWALLELLVLALKRPLMFTAVTNVIVCIGKKK